MAGFFLSASTFAATPPRTASLTAGTDLPIMRECWHNDAEACATDLSGGAIRMTELLSPSELTAAQGCETCTQVAKERLRPHHALVQQVLPD